MFDAITKHRLNVCLFWESNAIATINVYSRFPFQLLAFLHTRPNTLRGFRYNRVYFSSGSALMTNDQ